MLRIARLQMAFRSGLAIQTRFATDCPCGFFPAVSVSVKSVFIARCGRSLRGAGAPAPLSSSRFKPVAKTHFALARTLNDISPIMPSRIFPVQLGKKELLFGRKKKTKITKG
jgi:hypothetical protein